MEDKQAKRVDSGYDRQGSNESETTASSDAPVPKRRWMNTVKSKLSSVEISESASFSPTDDSTGGPYATKQIRKLSSGDDDEYPYSDTDEDDAVEADALEDWLADVEYISGESGSVDLIDVVVAMNDDVYSQEVMIADQLRGIKDLQFDTLSVPERNELVNSIGIIEKAAHEVIIKEGDDDDGGCFYFVLGPADAQVEVVRMVNGAEEFLTRLGAGEYFGQKYFMNNRTVRRNATVRAVTAVTLGSIPPEFFLLWHKFRTFLLMKAVPLIRTLPQHDQLEMYSMLQHQEFVDGEFIIRQGDVGDKFYIITDGMADVIEESWDGYHYRREVLTRLYEGHFFGEMAIIFDEPRVASVIAVGRTSCLYLSKAAFRQALTAQQFHRMMQNVAYERILVRERREKTHQMIKLQSTSSASTALSMQAPDDSYSASVSYDSFSKLPPRTRRRTSDSSTTNRSPRSCDKYENSEEDTGEVTTTNVLVRRRLSTGDRFINKYLVLRELGRGSFGEVYLCRNDENDKLYAMKSITKSARKWTLNLTDDIKREIAIMKRLRHPNVVSLYEVIDDPTAKQVYLIQEYLEGGPLLPGEDVVTKPLPSDKVWLYFRDMLRGVSYLHSQGVVHRDLKPQNMLLTADNQVKIADFGAAVLTGGGAKVLAAGGTPAFMAPELFRVGMKEEELVKVTMSPQVDVWSLGATLYNMVFGRPPWMAKNQIELAQQIQNIELHFPGNTVDPHLRNLLKRMLEKDPKTRISMAELSWHEWVTKEGSMSLDDVDDFHLAEYDVRNHLSAKVIDEAIPEFCGAIPLRRVVGSMITSAVHKEVDSVTAQALKSHGIAFPNSTDKDGNDSCTSDKNVMYTFHYPLSKKPSSDSLHLTPRPSHYISTSPHSGSSSSANSGTFGYHNDALLEEALLQLEGDGNDSDCEISSNTKRPVLRGSPEVDKSATPSRRLLRDTKNQTFVAQPTEMVITESGELWKGVIITNAKNRSKNSGFNWTSPNTKRVNSTRKFGRSSTFSSDEQNDSDTSTDKRQGLFPKCKSQGFEIGRNRSNSDASSSAASISTRNKVQSSTDVSSSSGMRASDGDSSKLDDRHAMEKLGNFVRNDRILDEFSDVLHDPSLNKLLSSESLHATSEISEVSHESESCSSYSDSEEEEVEVLLNITDRPKSLKSLELVKRRSTRGGGEESEDEVVAIDGLDLENMLDSLCIPEQTTKSDHQLLPIVLDRRGTDSLFNVKTFVGQSNLRLGIRYGMAEIVNSRDYQEDRTTAKASVEEDAKRIKARALSGAPPNSSFHIDYSNKSPTEDFAFFGIFDGHEGSYVSEYLQQHLHLRFRQRLSVNGSASNGVIDSFLEAASLVDEEILLTDFERMKNAKLSRESVASAASSDSVPACLSDAANRPADSSTRSITTQKSLIQEMGTQSFAGSTAVVAILYGGWPYETLSVTPRTSTGSHVSHSSQNKTSPPRSVKSHTPRTSGTSDGTSIKTLRTARASNASDGSNKTLQSLINSDSFYNSLQPDRLHVHTSFEYDYPASERPEVKLFVAHIGDSRAVLSEAGIAVQLTMDHSPNNAVEKDRIEAAGGWVQKGRVNGVLGVSRSFGDIMFKNFNPIERTAAEIESDLGSVWQSTNQVVSLPETLELVVHPSYEFLVLASDGLFEKCSCEDIVNFIRRRLIEHGDAQRAATEMVEKVEMQGSADNTSVLVICLNQIAKVPSLSSSSHATAHSSMLGASMSPTLSVTEENLRALRGSHTGSWRRLSNLRTGSQASTGFIDKHQFNDSFRSGGRPTI